MEGGLKTWRGRSKICMTGTDYSKGRMKNTVLVKLQVDFLSQDFLAHSANSYPASRKSKKSRYKLKPPEMASEQP